MCCDIPNEFIKKKRVGVPRRIVRIARWEKKANYHLCCDATGVRSTRNELDRNVRCARCELKNHSCEKLVLYFERVKASLYFYSAQGRYLESHR